MSKKKIVMQTVNREIYNKLNLLNIVPEVIIENNNKEITRIVNFINKKNDSVEARILSKDMVLVKKKRHDTMFDIYFR
jgi:hypothetical protein